MYAVPPGKTATIYSVISNLQYQGGGEKSSEKHSYFAPNRPANRILTLLDRKVVYSLRKRSLLN